MTALNSTDTYRLLIVVAVLLAITAWVIVAAWRHKVNTEDTTYRLTELARIRACAGLDVPALDPDKGYSEIPLMPHRHPDVAGLSATEVRTPRTKPLIEPKDDPQA